MSVYYVEPCIKLATMVKIYQREKACIMTDWKIDLLFCSKTVKISNLVFPFIPSLSICWIIFIWGGVRRNKFWSEKNEYVIWKL